MMKTTMRDGEPVPALIVQEDPFAHHAAMDVINGIMRIHQVFVTVGKVNVVSVKSKKMQ